MGTEVPHEDGGTSSLAAAVVDGGGGPFSLQQQKTAELDAGALFVLKSKGSWAHCGYHLTTSIVAPPLLSLPFAFTLLGWGGGVVCLVVAAAVTFYNYNLLSLVLEHHAHLGNRLFRFRDMANLILGPKWARYYVGPIQFIVCYGAVVACILLGGQCMKRRMCRSIPTSRVPETALLLLSPTQHSSQPFISSNGILATNKLITRKPIRRPKERTILGAKCCPEDRISVGLGGSRHHHDGNAAIFRRHQRYNRSFRFHPIGFHFAPCVLQPDFQAFQEEPRFLAQLRHRRCIRGGRSYCRRRRRLGLMPILIGCSLMYEQIVEGIYLRNRGIIIHHLI